VLPAVIAELPDRVVWLPTNARGCAVRAKLGAVGGDLVTLSKIGTPPVVGLGGDS
jgi:NADH-quinone oxidoreductase subunit G